MYTLHGRKYRGAQTEMELERLFPNERARNDGFAELIRQALQHGYQVDFQSKKGQLRVQFAAGKARGWVWTAFGGTTPGPEVRTSHPEVGGAYGSGVPARHLCATSREELPGRERGAGMRPGPGVAPSTHEDEMSTSTLQTVTIGLLVPALAYLKAQCPEHGVQTFNKKGGCPVCAFAPGVRQRQAPPVRKPLPVQVDPVVLGPAHGTGQCEECGEGRLNKHGACPRCYQAATESAWTAYYAERQQPAQPDVTGAGIEVVAKEPEQAPADGTTPEVQAAPPAAEPVGHVNPFETARPLGEGHYPAPVVEEQVLTAPEAAAAPTDDPFVEEPQTPAEPVVTIESEVRPARRSRRARQQG